VSIKPNKKMSFRHDVINAEHQIAVYDSEGNVFIKCKHRNFETCFSNASTLMHLKIQNFLKEENLPYLRGILKPSDKKGTGLLPIEDQLWDKVTLLDWKNNHLGLISQSELARIRGVSRQAIHQSILRGDLEIFHLDGLKFIPFDTVAITAENKNNVVTPYVMFFKNVNPNAKTKRLKRCYALQPKLLEFSGD
jgi:hypothetical protein